MLIASYLKQRVKMSDVRNTWSALRKGAPQGSVLGPFIFNFFKMIYCIVCFNYADDNIIGVLGYSVHDVLSQLKNAYAMLCYNCGLLKLHAG